jgi:transposase
LRNFGLKVGIAGKVKFEARIKELVESFPDLAVLVEPLLVVRRVLREQLKKQRRTVSCTNLSVRAARLFSLPKLCGRSDAPHLW